MIGIKYQNDTPKYKLDKEFFFTRYHSYSIGDWSNIRSI